MAKFRKRDNKPIVAVQVDLNFGPLQDGFTYQKWGGDQRCKRGDWIVDNDGETYTIDQETFAATYRQVSPGQYVKDAPVWAVVAQEHGRIKTKEGLSDYEPGDYLVSNKSDGGDSYCVKAAKFEAMYDSVGGKGE